MAWPLLIQVVKWIGEQIEEYKVYWCCQTEYSEKHQSAFAMIIRLKFRLLLLLCLVQVVTYAQAKQSPTLNLGDPAPPLRVREWLKGTPFQKFEKGHVYVLEYWATWCIPCKAAMPHLSALAREYKDKITFLGIDVMERKTTSMKKIRRFVDSMGQQMDYDVAAEDSNFMVAGWMEASEQQGIPCTFVVNAEGRLAWIGHPKDLPEILPKILSNDWNVHAAATKRNLDKYLFKLDTAANYTLMDYSDKPDLKLLAIDTIVRNEPKLKYAPFIAYNTLCALLQTNQSKAYEYGKAVLVTPTYEEPAYYFIIQAIDYFSKKMKLPAEIYQLGAEAYQAQNDAIPYPELVNMAKRYNKTAEWYGRSGDKAKAIHFQQKAIEAMKSKKDFSAADLAELEVQLQQYKK